MESASLDRVRFVTRHFNNLQGLRYWVPLGLITLSGGGTTYFTSRPLVLLRAELLLGGILLMFGARRYYRRTFGQVETRPVYPAGELHSLSIYSPAGTISRLEGAQQMTPIVRHFLITIGLGLVLFSVLQAITPTVVILGDESLLHLPWSTLDMVFLRDEPWTRGVKSIIGRSWWWPPSTAKAILGQTMYALYGSLFLGVWLWRGRRLSQSYHLVLGVLLWGLSAFGASLGYFWLEDRGIPRVVLDLTVPVVVHLWVALLLCGASMILAGLLDHWQLVRVLGRPAAPSQEGHR
jgi:hypothetical protein